MIYGNRSIKGVISKIVRDGGLGPEEINYQDFVEWIYQALLQIGAYPQFEEKEAEIKIENHKGEFPCDFYKPIRILNKSEYPNSAGIRDDHNSNLIGNSNQIEDNKVTNFDYNVSHNQITTSYKTGKLRLQYLAIPVDEDNLPLIPDHVSYEEAITWFVFWRLSIQGNILKNPQLDIVYTQRMWNHYCMQARNKANMPNIDQLERIKNNWLSLVPDTNKYDSLFHDLGKPQINIPDGKY